MSKIAQAFDHGKAFIPFVTAGDPDLETTKELLPVLQESGADLIEIGIPFSDPVAEGIVIQKADERALAAGTTTDKIFDMVESIQDKMHVPMVFMTYANVIFVYGIEKFAKRSKEIGMSGVIIPDVPFEEKDKVFRQKIDQFKQASLVITDRLHGMVFCAITGTPCIALSNYNHKVLETAKWLKEFPFIRYCSDAAEAANAIPELYGMKGTYSNAFALPYYEKILKTAGIEK